MKNCKEELWNYYLNWELTKALKKLKEHKFNNNIVQSKEEYIPYKKQLQFHKAGKNNTERLFLAGNQVGKSKAGAEEVAIHLKGEYPSWWKGKRFKKPCNWWVATVTESLLFNNMRITLLGLKDNNGNIIKEGLINDYIVEPYSKGRGFLIPYKGSSSGEYSRLVFMSYKQGREAWQAAVLEGIWFDEEPPIDIYLEGLTRVQKRNGIVMLTMTPLKGRTNLVNRFLESADIDNISSKIK